MPVVPINSNYSNIGAFVDSLYSADVRNLSVLQTAIQSGQMIAPFSSEGDKILAVWIAAWQQSQGDPYNPTNYSYCPQSDQGLMAFLSGYMKANGLSLFVPSIQYLDNTSAGLPIYQLNGYQGLAFMSSGAWNYANVEQFLSLLLYGAHFVVIEASADLPHGPVMNPCFTDFRQSALYNNERWDPANSHYTSLLNVCGYYYPSVESDSAPTPCPFALAFLVGMTVSEIGCNPCSFDTFFQLEGWEAPQARHISDYELYNQTLWNISTYGACAYSEKRATAVFLAPAVWNPQPTSKTYMPPYVGAETPQSWLNTEVITLPGS